MVRSKILAVLAAATIPFFMTAWVELQAIDQPSAVDPGQTFAATVSAVAHIDGGPIPLDRTILPSAPRDESTTLRMGVLVPTDWKVSAIEWAAAGRFGSLKPSPEEAGTYGAYYPPPGGYMWRTFLGEPLAVAEGDSINYVADITAGSKTGLYRIVYMTWSQPPYLYGGGAEPPGSPMPPVDDYPYPVPGPSLLETTVAVGDVGPAPQVVAWDPPDGAADVPRDTDIRVTFDRDMDVDSLRNGGLQLFAGPVWYATDTPVWQEGSSLDPDFRPPPWGPDPVAVQIFYNAATKTAVIDPSDALLGHTAYTVMVTYTAQASDGVPVDLVRTAEFLTERRPQPAFFPDVPADHRFRTAIEALYDAGIVDGYLDGTFRPDAPVTRAQIAKWLVLLLGVHTEEPGPPPPFSDLPTQSGEASVDFIGEAARAGITQGFDDGTFRPDDSVTRIQLTRMIIRATQGWLSAPPPDFSAGFADVDAADQGFVNWGFYNDLVDGTAPGRFDPWGTATRGHAARILYGAWVLMQGPIPVPEDGTSGIQGTVTLGPLQPVSREGEPNERPYEATVAVRTADGSREVTRFRSGADGRFHVSLSPSDYLLVPLAGDPFPTAPSQMVTVGKGGFSQVIIQYDTGIR
jgi:hypothetical protein